MKTDVQLWAQSAPTGKLPCKETLNHAALISRVSGLDVYEHTPEAFRRAYAALGIDIINRVPLDNAAKRMGHEPRRHPEKPYLFTELGVYDTAFRHTYPCATPDELWQIDPESLRYEDLITPVPHSLDCDDIRRREQAIGELGVYYPMLYTTLFMWPVECFGWEVFMEAAITEPDRFHDLFLTVFAEKSKVLVTAMADASECPFVFVHDDLAAANGPVFPPSWYDDYIFPHYPEIFAPAKQRGKKIMFVADGDMSVFLPKLIESGVDGIHFENPATPLEVVEEQFGQTGRAFIGGAETGLLTRGTPEQVRKMVQRLERCTRYPGFVICSPGGLHENIPMENLEAYFDARVALGATPENWRTAMKLKLEFRK